MIDKSKPGRAFEDYVAFVQQALIMCEGQNIEVKRRHKVLDTTGASHEIDVYYEFDLAGVRHRVAMECKDWKKGVDLQRVRAFHSLVLDLPSTIGVVISRNGFQSGAKDFLEKKGVLYFDGDDLPTLGDAAAAITRAAVLPSDLSIGQPFWGLAFEEGGETTGDWIQLRPGVVAMARGTAAMFPLFLSRPDAVLFKKEFDSVADDTCVRGLPQTTLRFLLAVAPSMQTEFAVMKRKRFRLNGSRFRREKHSITELAERYLPEGELLAPR